MQNKPASSAEIWRGRPWILPEAVARTVAILIVTLIFFWAEFYFGVASDDLGGLSIVWWTGIIFFVAWLIVLASLLLLRQSHEYILRGDSLEVREGIVSMRSYTIVPSGFSDLEVEQSALGRMLNYGDIIVRVQSDVRRRMIKVRSPMAISDQMRDVLAHPVVRIDPSWRAPPRPQN